MLSGVPRPHRIHLWRSIQSRVRSTDIVVINRFAHWHVDRDLSQGLPWSNHPELIEPDQERALTQTPTTSIRHPAYRACVNLPLETVWHRRFMTEKTWKAVVAGCLPWHGHAGLASWFRDLGFRDWFGETSGSGTTAQDLFDRDDLWDFYHDNLAAVYQAQDHFWSQDLLIQQTESAVDRLENWLTA